MKNQDFLEVTELAGAEISPEQLYRLCNRYYWAGSFCKNRDVLEVACGTGPGLGYLKTLAKSVQAGDYSQVIVDIARKHYGEKYDIRCFDAQDMPYADNSIDAIIVHEALYYIPDAEKFVAECLRLLRPGGVVLVSNANKDLYDFNPSPHSFEYHGVIELRQLFAKFGFLTSFWGSVPLTDVSLKQKMLRPIKKMVISLNLMPRTMTGKRLLKKFVFGEPVLMPSEVTENMTDLEKPRPLDSNKADTKHKVIYCSATLTSQ